MSECKISLTLDNIFKEATWNDFCSLKEKMEACNRMLHEGTGEGSEFLGWVDLPVSYTEEQIVDMIQTSEEFRCKADVILVIGIGGSYLGAKAILDALSSNFDWLSRERRRPIVIFEGQNISEDYIYELLQTIRGSSVATVVISKSGTTTETAIAFRIVREEMEKWYGKEETRKRIVAITSEKEGALRKIADSEGYKSYPIADNIGGRYSVFTEVGLVPLAMAGIDIRELLKGAAHMRELVSDKVPFEENLSAQYAAARNVLYNKLGKKVEIFASYQPKLHSIAEWWKQLFAESEGKNGKGLFPASVTYTTDLHSIGQYIQSGERIIFETVLSIREYRYPVYVPKDDENLDQLNYLVGKRISEVNRMAEFGTMLAHVDGGVPNIRIEMERISEFCIGQLLYMFEKACGISAYALGVNPFDQPGVEEYKKNLFALLDKPGYSDRREELLKRID